MNGKIIQADCLDALKTIDANSVHMTLFSPPYDGIRRYGGDWVFDYQALGDALYRVTVSGGVAVVIINDSTSNFAKSLTTARLTVDWVDNRRWKLFETIIYQRHGRPGAWWRTRFRVDHEYILVFFKGARPRVFHKEHLMIPSKHAGRTYGGTTRHTDGSLSEIGQVKVNDTKDRGTIWPYATSNSEGNRLKLQHPATFPDLLAADLIKCFSAPGDTVLDPMCGSGTTCVQAAVWGRDYIGIDIEAAYCDIARTRLRNEAGIEQINIL